MLDDLTCNQKQARLGFRKWVRVTGFHVGNIIIIIFVKSDLISRKLNFTSSYHRPGYNSRTFKMLVPVHKRYKSSSKF